MAGMRAPGNFNPIGSELASGWKKWVEQYDFYMKATEKDKKDSDVQVAILLTLLGPDSMDIFRSFEWATEIDKDDVDIVKEKFRIYYTPRINETYQRYKFLKRKQEQGESFDSFLTDLKNLVSSCGYHIEEKGKVLRDQIVMGISSNTVREKLLDPESLTVTVAIDLCRSSEITGQLMTGMSAESLPIHSVRGQRSSTQRRFKKDAKPNFKAQTKPNCRFCGGIHEPRKCPAYGQECRACGRQNHYAKCCDNFSKNNKAHAHTVKNNNDHVGSIVYSVDESCTSKEWHAVLDIGGRGLKVKIGTGASCNVLSSSDYGILSEAQPDSRLSNCHTKLRWYGGHHLDVKGKVTYTAEYKCASTVGTANQCRTRAGRENQ